MLAIDENERKCYVLGMKQEGDDEQRKSIRRRNPAQRLKSLQSTQGNQQMIRRFSTKFSTDDLYAIVEHDIDTHVNIAYKIGESENLPLVYEYLQEAEEKKLEFVCHHDKKESKKDQVPTHVFILEIEQIQAAIVIETQNPIFNNKVKQEKKTA